MREQFEEKPLHFNVLPLLGSHRKSSNYGKHMFVYRKTWKHMFLRQKLKVLQGFNTALGIGIIFLMDLAAGRSQFTWQTRQHLNIHVFGISKKVETSVWPEHVLAILGSGAVVAISRKLLILPVATLAWSATGLLRRLILLRTLRCRFQGSCSSCVVLCV